MRIFNADPVKDLECIRLFHELLKHMKEIEAMDESDLNNVCYCPHCGQEWRKKMRPIDADALKEWFSTTFAEDDTIDNREIREVIDDFPTVEKKGKWTWESVRLIFLDYGETAYEPRFRCSCCGHITESYVCYDEPSEADADYPNYCPNCGADMRGTEDEP